MGSVSHDYNDNKHITQVPLIPKDKGLTPLKHRLDPHDNSGSGTGDINEQRDQYNINETGLGTNHVKIGQDPVLTSFF